MLLQLGDERLSYLLQQCKRGCNEACKLPLPDCSQAGCANAGTLNLFGAGTGTVGPPGMA